MSETWLGLDFGTKKIGVAVGQTVTCTANTLGIITANEGEPNWRELETLIKQWNPQGFVVGIPYDMQDQITAITEKALQFAERLQQRYQLPVFQIDEKLTSFVAKEELKSQKTRFSKQEVDSLAAKYILESWLQNRISDDHW